MRQAKDAEPWIQGNQTGGDDEKERGNPGPRRGGARAGGRSGGDERVRERADEGRCGRAAGTSEKEAPPYAPEVAEENAANYAPQIDPSNFVDKIDNRYMMFTPGTTFIYEGKTADGPERVETYVSHKTREVLGVKCTVVRDKAFLNGKLSEDTFDWYAQDKEGNVWYFGEDTKEYENGKVVSTKGSWEAGVDGAKPGIVMEANPRVGDSYRQEYYEGEAEDMAEVLSLDASGLNDAVSVPYGSFGDVLMTKEWNPLEPRRPRVQVLRARHGAHRRRADPGRNGHERAGGHQDRAVVAPSRELDPAASQGCCILWSSISIV